MLQATTAKRASPQQPIEWNIDGPPVALRGDALERWYGRLYTPGPKGVDRSYSLWQIAIDLRDAGCSPAFIEQCLAERDVALGWEAFTHRTDIARRYRIITERAVAGQGSKRVRLNTAEPKQEPKRKVPAQPLLFETIDEFNASESADIEWIVKGYLGVGMIVELDGAVKRSGKTTLLLSMCAAILHGELFLEQETTYAPILYLTEQPGPTFKYALSRSGLVDGDAFHILRWINTRDWAWEQVVPEAVAYAKRVGARVLIVDTLPQFAGLHGDAENSSGAALETLEPLQVAATEGLAILISRHDRKSGGEVGESGRGSSAFLGGDDIILHLTRHADPRPGTERQRLLTSTGRTADETPEKVVIALADGAPYTYSVVGDPVVVKRHDVSVDVLANTPTDTEKPIAHSALKMACGSPDNFAAVVGELVRQRRLVRLGMGKKGDPWRYYQVPYGEAD